MVSDSVTAAKYARKQQTHVSGSEMLRRRGAEGTDWDRVDRWIPGCPSACKRSDSVILSSSSSFRSTNAPERAFSKTFTGIGGSTGEYASGLGLAGAGGTGSPEVTEARREERDGMEAVVPGAEVGGLPELLRENSGIEARDTGAGTDEVMATGGTEAPTPAVEREEGAVSTEEM